MTKTCDSCEICARDRRDKLLIGLYEGRRSIFFHFATKQMYGILRWSNSVLCESCDREMQKLLLDMKACSQKSDDLSQASMHLRYVWQRHSNVVSTWLPSTKREMVEKNSMNKMVFLYSFMSTTWHYHQHFYFLRVQFILQFSSYYKIVWDASSFSLPTHRHTHTHTYVAYE